MGNKEGEEKEMLARHFINIETHGKKSFIPQKLKGY
jgi:hypothetical protein